MNTDNKEQKALDFIIETLSDSEYFFDESDDYFIFLYNISLVCDTFVNVSKKKLINENIAMLNIEIVNNLTKGFSLEESLNKALTPFLIARLEMNNYCECKSFDPHVKVFSKK